MSNTNPGTSRFRFTIQSTAILVALIAVALWCMVAFSRAQSDLNRMQSPQLEFPQVWARRLIGRAVPYDRNSLIEARDRDERLAHYYCSLTIFGGAILISLWISRRRMLARWFKWATVIVVLSTVIMTTTWWITSLN